MSKIPQPPGRDPNFIPGPHGMGVQLPEPLDPATCQHALIDPQGNVINVIIWDGVSPYTPPDGHILVQSVTADIGDTYDGQNFKKKGQPATNPPSNNPPPTA